MRTPNTPEVPPRPARALPEGILVDCRACPVCQKLLTGKQKLCSGRCRATWSREQQAREQAERDSEVRLRLKQALAGVEAALGLLENSP